MKYLAFIWAEGRPAPEDVAVMQRELPGWDEEMTGRGVRLLGRELTLLSDGPFTNTKEFIAGIDVVSCADRQQAIQLAAAHPIARYHAIEVRPFYKE